MRNRTPNKQGLPKEKLYEEHQFPLLHRNLENGDEARPTTGYVPEVILTGFTEPVGYLLYPMYQLKYLGYASRFSTPYRLSHLQLASNYSRQ